MGIKDTIRMYKNILKQQYNEGAEKGKELKQKHKEKLHGKKD